MDLTIRRFYIFVLFVILIINQTFGFCILTTKSMTIQVANSATV